MSTTGISARIVCDVDRLERSERVVSARRRQFHHDIDQLYLAAASRRQKTQLRDVDRLGSLGPAPLLEERPQLHETVDELRVQIGLPPSRDALDVDSAA